MLTGTCNQTCSTLAAHNPIVIINSTITFTSHITVATLPDDQGTMILHKDGSSVTGQNINHTALNLSPVTFYIHNAQLMDSGIYYTEYNGMHATLFSNEISIEVVRLNSTSSSSDGKYFCRTA